MSDTERNEAIEYLSPLSEHPTMTGNFAKHLKTAITALRTQSEAEKKIERIENVMEYFAESGNHARALYIIQCILDGMTDEEIMEENNNA